ncbi:alpha/beta hydrolase [Sphingomonas nostoxanthinifaciens]|nr:alpha/beta hydrolase [Sphingomonas nostoxanthinifaciens]
MGGAAVAGTLTWADLTSRPRPTGAVRIAYGADPLQFADLWLPASKGPHPVVLMVHGGCWQTDIAEAKLMDWAAADLARRGIAVWNVEYRGVDRPGGGYPGTFHDVAAGADALRDAATRYGLRLDRVVAVGHSAGGHLALWLAARAGLPKNSVLRSSHPLPLHGVISLGGLPDLEAAAQPPGDTCGPDAVPRLVGAPGTARPDVYADTSPARLPQPAILLVAINGAVDRIAPPATAEAYTRRTGAPLRRIVVPAEGHVEEIAPGSKAWAAAVEAIETALR